MVQSNLPFWVLKAWMFHLSIKYVPEKMSVLYLLLQSCADVPGVSATFTRELLLSLRKSLAIWASFKATWKKTRV